MSYMCKYRNKECDSCGECQPEPKLTCNTCGEPIYEGDPYFEIDGFEYCTECAEENFMRYA